VAVAVAVAELVKTTTLSVGEYQGEEVAAMFHGTDSRAAQLIAAAQRFEASDDGLLGPGVYLTRTRQKAEGYRVHHPGAEVTRNLPLFSGEPDPGCVLQCRVRLGVCKTLHRDDPRHALTSWHDTPVPKRTQSDTVKGAVERAPRQIRYNSAYSRGCDCCPVHGENCPGHPDRGHKFQMGQQPCLGRCKTGLRNCPRANSTFEEFCVFNPSRIDRIEIVDGPSELVGFGRELWGSDRDALDVALRSRQEEFVARETAVMQEASAACKDAAAAMLKAVSALDKASQLAPHRYKLQSKARQSTKLFEEIKTLCADDDESSSESDTDLWDDSDDSIEFKVRDRVEIYSKSQQGWCEGKITEVDPAAGTVKVEYRTTAGSLMQKVVMDDSPDLRLVSPSQPQRAQLPVGVTVRMNTTKAYACRVIATKETGSFNITTRYTIRCDWQGFSGDSEHRYSGACWKQLPPDTFDSRLVSHCNLHCWDGKHRTVGAALLTVCLAFVPVCLLYACQCTYVRVRLPGAQNLWSMTSKFASAFPKTG
jgi:hypothetical protein